jgi:hypothetical protein
MRSTNSIALKFCLCFLALALSSCGLLPKKGTKVKVSSNPSAEVIVGDGSHDIGSSIGRTPLDVNFKEIAKGEYIYLKFQSEKHEDYQLIVPSDWSQGEINVKLKQKEKILPAEVEDKMVEKMKELSTSQILGVLEFQKQLQQGQFGKASAEIVNLRRLRTPEAVVAMLDGNLSYVKGDKKGALAFYRRALSLYPQNYEVRALIDQLQK